MDHKAEAERLLIVSANERDAAWAQAWATQAQAHATLAGLLAPIQMTRTSPQHVWPDPGPRIWSSTDHDVANEPIIVFRGKDVS